MKYIISIFVIIQLFSPDCYGAAENNQESALIELIGVACKQGTLSVKKGVSNDGTYTCAYAHTIENHITQEQLKELAESMFADVQQGGKGLDLVYGVLDPERRSFSLDEEQTHLALGAFMLRAQEMIYTTVRWKGLYLLEGEILGSLEESISSTHSRSHSLAIALSTVLNKARWIDGYHRIFEIPSLTGKPLDEVAKEVFNAHVDLGSEGVVVVIDAASVLDQNQTMLDQNQTVLDQIKWICPIA